MAHPTAHHRAQIGESMLAATSMSITRRERGLRRPGSGPVAQWFQRTALLRNRVVHCSYIPTGRQAEDAYGAAFPMEKFVFDRLVLKRGKYPHARLIAVAQSGLERRGHWSGRRRR